MSKSCISITNIFCLSFILIYFLLPKSISFVVSGDFREFSNYLKPWYIQRYILVALMGGYTFLMVFLLKFRLSYNQYLYFIGFIFLSIALLFSGDITIIYALLGMTSSFFLVSVHQEKLLGVWSLRLIEACFFIYILYFFVHKVGGRVTGSFLDPNISGYYLFLIYGYYRITGGKVLSIFILLVGISTLSRNFFLAVLIFEIFKLGVVSNFVKPFGFLRLPAFLSITSVILVITTSLFVIQVANHSKTIGGTTDRLTNINDGSNYARAKANVSMVERLLDGEFILSGNGQKADTRTEHRPHNAFLRAIYRYGAVASFFCFLAFFFVSKNLLLKHQAFYFSLFAYYSLLNDFITGSEIVLVSCVIIAANRKVECYKLSKLLR